MHSRENYWRSGQEHGACLMYYTLNNHFGPCGSIGEHYALLEIKSTEAAILKKKGGKMPRRHKFKVQLLLLLCGIFANN